MLQNCNTIRYVPTHQYRQQNNTYVYTYVPFFPLTSYDVNWCKPHCTRQKCICGTASRRMHRRGGLGGSSNRRGRLRTLIYNPMSTTKLTTTSSCCTTALVYGLKYLFLLRKICTIIFAIINIISNSIYIT